MFENCALAKNSSYHVKRDPKTTETEMDTSQPEDIPQSFLCPITLAVMNDPVIDNYGVSYERQAICEWLNAGNSTSPTTGKELTVNDLRPNRALRETIEKLLGVEGMVHSPPRSTESMPENTLPAPKPSATTGYEGSNYTYSSPFKFSDTNRDGPDFNGACFLGSSLVHMAGQKFRRADQIKKGDKVFTGAGLIDEVECVLKTCYDEDEPQLLYQINENLVATAWHPVKNEADQWTFPAESSSAKAITVYTEGVYSFLLKNRGTILLGDTECATLAHGLQGEVIEHEFLGTETVAADLKRFDQFQSGLVEVTPEAFQRNPDTGRINAIRIN